MVNWKLLSPAGLIIAGIAGCGPLNFPYIYASVGRPSYQTDGAILVSGSYFTPRPNTMSAFSPMARHG